MTVLIRKVALAAAVAIAAAWAAPALAGGDDYEGADDTAAAGPAFFGFVWDQRGSPVPDARVVLRAKNGRVIELKTNILGLYRSHIGKDVRADDVQVSCDKAGYKQTRVARRVMPGLSSMTIEVDCTLQRQ